MSAIIYLLTNTVNGKQYVGQTSVGLEERWKRHCRSARCGVDYHLYRAIRKYGPDTFTHEILEHTTIEDVNARETYWVAELKTKEHGYNMTEGGGGTRGWVPSDETRAKISTSLKGKYGGEKHYMYGKTPSQETRAKMRASGKVKIFTVEHRAKLGDARAGKETFRRTPSQDECVCGRREQCVLWQDPLGRNPC